MLDADMNVRYWTHLSRQYYKWERLIKIFLAIMASGTVASWSFWADLSILWKILSALAAITAIISPLLKLDATIESLSTIKGKWKKVLSDYETLWLSRKNKAKDELIKEYSRIKGIENEIDEKNLPKKKKLVLQIQDEVEISRGIRHK